MILFFYHCFTFSHFVRFMFVKNPILTVDFPCHKSFVDWSTFLWITGSLEDSSSHATAAEGLEEGEVACDFLISTRQEITYPLGNMKIMDVQSAGCTAKGYMIYVLYVSIRFIWGSFFGKPWRNSLDFMLPSILLQPARPKPGSKPGCHYPEKPTKDPACKFFPTCQVRVVRFYVSLFSFSSSSFSSSFSSSSSSSCRPPPPAILWVQCGVLDLNCDPVSSVWHAGPQPRSCEVSVACRTPTAILRVQCGVPDPNRDPANSVWRPGPQPRSCEFSVASRTPTAILWVQCGVPDLKYCVRKFVRKNDRRYVRRNVKKICQKICQQEFQKICQKICQKECQKICQKECQKICQKEW